MGYSLIKRGTSISAIGLVIVTGSTCDLNLSARSSSFTTGDFGDNEHISLCTGVVPNYLEKPTTATLVNSYRMNIGDALASDASGSYNRNKFDVMRAACWHRYTIATTGGMKIDSIEPKLQPVGTGQ